MITVMLRLRMHGMISPMRPTRTEINPLNTPLTRPRIQVNKLATRVTMSTTRDQIPAFTVTVTISRIAARRPKTT